LENAWIKRGTSLLKKLFRIVSKVEGYAREYRKVRRWHKRIVQIALILEPAKHKTSQSVEKRLSQYLRETEKKLNKEEDVPFIVNLMKYSKGFWKGLFPDFYSCAGENYLQTLENTDFFRLQKILSLFFVYMQINPFITTKIWIFCLF
jgi:hypothetical protein